MVPTPFETNLSAGSIRLALCLWPSSQATFTLLLKCVRNLQPPAWPVPSWSPHRLHPCLLQRNCLIHPLAWALSILTTAVPFLSMSRGFLELGGHLMWTFLGPPHTPRSQQSCCFAREWENHHNPSMQWAPNDVFNCWQLLLICMCVHMHMWEPVPRHVRRGWRTTFRNQFSPCTMCFLRTQVMASGLVPLPAEPSLWLPNNTLTF